MQENQKLWSGALKSKVLKKNYAKMRLNEAIPPTSTAVRTSESEV